MSEFETFVSPIIEMPVTAVWRGGGSAIFLEFGEGPDAAPREAGERRTGAFTLMVEWSWRIEGETRILAGIFSEDHVIEEALYGCAGRHVESVELFGRLPEVAVALSGGRRVLSFMTAAGDPEWTIFDNRGPGSRWVHAVGGALAFDGERSATAKP